jgi:parallel beta-helix repeat protein
MKKRCVIDGQWFWTVLVTLLGLAALPSPGAADHITCGAVLGPGGTFTLDSDVGPCPDPVVITVHAATLKLTGHTVTGTAVGLTGQHCVELIGGGAVLRGPGTVQGCERGVVVRGTGRHEVQDVVSQGNTNVGFSVVSGRNAIVGNTSTLNTHVGFTLLSQRNLLTNNTASSHGNFGFDIHGELHEVENNTAHDNGEHGFHVFGDATFLRSNTAEENGTGFAIPGHRNALQDNTAHGNSLQGFRILGESNTFRDNVAADNGANGFAVQAGATHNVLLLNTGTNNFPFDLADDNPNCDQNRWRSNTGTRNQPCIR